jgi:hypothetical protein
VRRIVGLLAIAALFAGCIASGEPAQPQPCRQVFNAVRCLAMTDYAAVQLKVRREDIAAIDILPEPTPETHDVMTTLQTRSGGPPIDVRVTMTDGSTQLASMHCGGIASHPACVDDPHLTTGSVTGRNGGYHDTPCSGDPPDGCATPLPTIEPTAAAAARPLTIDRLDIPLDHVGPYEVKLGEATLPNGILTEASLALVDDWPPGVTITSGAVAIRVRSLEPDGKPFNNYFDHGWRAGTERVEAVLSFDVDHVDPGATLGIRDVMVR